MDVRVRKIADDPRFFEYWEMLPKAAYGNTDNKVLLIYGNADNSSSARAIDVSRWLSTGSMQFFVKASKAGKIEMYLSDSAERAGTPKIIEITEANIWRRLLSRCLRLPWAISSTLRSCLTSVSAIL